MSTIALEIDQILSHLPPEEASAAEQAIRAVLRLAVGSAASSQQPISFSAESADKAAKLAALERLSASLGARNVDYDAWEALVREGRR
jgi:hypothetical protein